MMKRTYISVLTLSLMLGSGAVLANNNTTDIDQIGSHQKAVAKNLGVSKKNDVTIYQEKKGNNFVGSQEYYNRAVTRIRGDGNTVVQRQEGSGNNAVLQGKSDKSYVRMRQWGKRNTATLHGTDLYEANIKIDQIGKDHTVNIDRVTGGPDMDIAQGSKGWHRENYVKANKLINAESVQVTQAGSYNRAYLQATASGDVIGVNQQGSHNLAVAK